MSERRHSSGFGAARSYSGTFETWLGHLARYDCTKHTTNLYVAKERRRDITVKSTKVLRSGISLCSVLPLCPTTITTLAVRLTP